MPHCRDLVMVNTLGAPVGNMRIFIRIRIRILHVVQSADPQVRIIPPPHMSPYVHARAATAFSITVSHWWVTDGRHIQCSVSGKL